MCIIITPEDLMANGFCIDVDTGQIYAYHDYTQDPVSGNYYCKKCNKGKE